RLFSVISILQSSRMTIPSKTTQLSNASFSALPGSNDIFGVILFLNNNLISSISPAIMPIP
ncbi:MAG: hypothetical protein IJE71_06320, partial [Clostridia bacterium]|nr:hypothetical protein [Clostridia bacterium]